MAIFEFDQSHLLGKVREVDTRKVSILVIRDEDLRKAHVGQLVALKMSGALDYWLIGIIDKVIKSVYQSSLEELLEESESETTGQEGVVNTVRLTLVGTVKWEATISKVKFSRSLTQVPEIDAECHVLLNNQLERFMCLLIAEGDSEHSLELGTYTLDESAKAYLDGNKFFQRHAALLGSTGSGKSWAVASILERAATLPTANLIVFDQF